MHCHHLNQHLWQQSRQSDTSRCLPSSACADQLHSTTSQAGWVSSRSAADHQCLGWQQRMQMVQWPCHLGFQQPTRAPPLVHPGFSCPSSYHYSFLHYTIHPVRLHCIINMMCIIRYTSDGMVYLLCCPWLPGDSAANLLLCDIVLLNYTNYNANYN